MTEYNFQPPELTLRYVAVCDVLGFKHKLDTLTLEELSRHYLALTLNIQHVIKINNTTFPDSPEKSDFVDYAIFSDTCLVWSAPLSATRTVLDLGPASCFFDTCNLFISMGISHDMPFRVGVSYGEVCIDKVRGLFVGKPISEAYLLEQSQKWIGGACHESCNHSPSFADASGPWHDTLPYDVPVSDGHQQLPALNWPRWSHERIIDKLTSQRALLTDHTVQLKYTEAVTFYQATKRTIDDAL